MLTLHFPDAGLDQRLAALVADRELGTYLVSIDNEGKLTAVLLAQEDCDAPLITYLS